MNRQKQFQEMADKLQGMFPLSNVTVWPDMVSFDVPGHQYTLRHRSAGWETTCDDSVIVASRFPLRPMTELQRNLREIYKNNALRS